MKKRITIAEFYKIPDPTIEQCLAFIRTYERESWRRFLIIKYVPEKHHEFCITQLKLEGLL